MILPLRTNRIMASIYRTGFFLLAFATPALFISSHNATAQSYPNAFQMHRTLSLPEPLNPEEEKKLRTALLLQEEGRFGEAQQLTKNLDIYWGPTTTGNYFLKTVLQAHNKSELEKERSHWLSLLTTESTPHPDLSVRKITHNRNLENQIHHALQANDASSETLLRIINSAHGISSDYAAWLETELSQNFLVNGDPESTLELARMAISNTHGKDATASFLTGLALWEKKAYRESIPFFEQATSIPYAPDDIQASSMFWTARAYGKARHNFLERLWLEKTAIFFPNTFYGFLALAKLDSNAILDGDRKTIPQLWETFSNTPLYNLACKNLKQEDINNLSRLPEGSYFFALLQLGERNAAEKLLLNLWSNTHNVNLNHSFLIIAKAAALKHAQEEIAKSIQNNQNAYERRYDLPMPNLMPQSGFIIDPALIYALVRVESNFNPRVKSGADARGLMQIQPVTADFITSSSMRHPNYWYRHHPNSLFSPQTNLSLGQDYVQYLAKLSRHVEYHKTPGGDIIRILASYNAGPAALEQWENLTDSPTDDPILFVELLPNKETHDYVRKTLTYLWRYAAKMRITTPSLFSLSQGIWPSFADETALAHRLDSRRNLKRNSR